VGGGGLPSQVSHCHCACVAAGEGGAAGRGRCHNSYMWPARRQLSWQSGPEIKTFRLTIFIDAIIDCVFMASLLLLLLLPMREQHCQCSCGNMLPVQQQHCAVNKKCLVLVFRFISPIFYFISLLIILLVKNIWGNSLICLWKW